MKSHKVLILTLFLFSFLILNPLHFIKPQSYHSSTNKPIPAPSENVLRLGIASLVGDWDPAITDWYNALAFYYTKSCLESLFWLPDYSVEPKSHLATDWTFEYWPEELNGVGFNIRKENKKRVNIKTLCDFIIFT